MCVDEREKRESRGRVLRSGRASSLPAHVTCPRLHFRKLASSSLRHLRSFSSSSSLAPSSLLVFLSRRTRDSAHGFREPIHTRAAARKGRTVSGSAGPSLRLPPKKGHRKAGLEGDGAFSTPNFWLLCVILKMNCRKASTTPSRRDRTHRSTRRSWSLARSFPYSVRWTSS